MIPEARAADFDAADPLAGFRERFTLPEGVIYLDGNSLGALPKATPARLQAVIEGEWGEGLIRSWNTASWFDMASRIGGKIAPLIGAAPHEVIACDSTSVNLFKLIAAALQMRPGRKVVLSEPGNFPTDLYMIAGLEAQGLATRRLAERDKLVAALDGDVALLMLTHAFETLGCHVVGWRTDNFNFASQRAIERLGAKKDGVIRGHALRRDGTIRDTVMYSMRQGEWPEAKAQLIYLLQLKSIAT